MDRSGQTVWRLIKYGPRDDVAPMLEVGVRLPGRGDHVDMLLACVGPSTTAVAKEPLTPMYYSRSNDLRQAFWRSIRGFF